MFLIDILIKISKINKNNNFEEVFKEGDYSIGETATVKIEKFKERDITYQIIDTIGIYDPRFSPIKVWDEIIKKTSVIKGGLNWIIFIVGDRRVTEEIPKAYQSLINIFGKEITEHIIIVRSNFPNFSKPDKCFEDYKKLVRGNEEIKSMVTSSKDFIYVDNPSLDNIDYDEDEIVISKQKRCSSRKKILERLEEESNKESYEGSDELNKKLLSGKKNIIKHVKRERKINEKLENLEEGILKETYKQIKEESQKKCSQTIEEYIKRKNFSQQQISQNEQGKTEPIDNYSGITFGISLLGILIGSILKGFVG